MTIKDALIRAKSQLGSYKNEALFILCEYLKKDRTWIFLHENLELNLQSYFDLIERFKSGEPFEYIFEKVDFWGLDFKITEGVFIPRYDSEVLLFEILQICKNNKFKNILEIGFGSGILSIVLAKELGVKITACDINIKALNVALENARIHRVDHLIEFKLCDFRKIRQNYDLIFSNPPYIKFSYPLDPWVQSEPREALFGGENGYEILEEIINFSIQREVEFLACEFAYDQKEILEKILRARGFKSTFFQDEKAYNRAFVAQFIQNNLKEKY